MTPPLPPPSEPPGSPVGTPSARAKAGGALTGGGRGDPPPEATQLSLLGVDYTHVKTKDGGDLYLTRYGRALWRFLLPENWYARDWFATRSRRLVGTSLVYHVPTRPLDGRVLLLVVKWSRVGEEVPINTLTVQRFIHTEFNSPFEEFALLMELRAGPHGPPEIRIRTQKPLAIYVPSERLQLWQTGRSESKMAAKLARAPSVELDILRQYVLLFGWVKGLDLVEAADWLGIHGRVRDRFLAHHTSIAMHELRLKGYRVIDMKPAHVVVRPRADQTLLRDRHGQLSYALVDYELLERTPEHEHTVRQVNRQHYLQHMARRFEVSASQAMPPHLQTVNLLGVDYIFGHCESTGGLLWVVGWDPDLFHYFLPERWRRTPAKRLSAKNDVFGTRTKDHILLVWKISRLGRIPTGSGPQARIQAMRDYGYNAPFEEFALALALSQRGIKTVYPRAIYMTGHTATTGATVTDPRRYTALADLRTPEGQPVVSSDHDYITLWGFWNGPDEMLAVRDGPYYQGVDAKRALSQNLLPPGSLPGLLDRARQSLAAQGFEDLNLKPDHLLLSYGPDQKMICADTGQPELRHCNFELMRRAAPSPA